MATRDWNNDGRNDIHDDVYDAYLMDSGSGQGSGGRGSGGGDSGCSWVVWGALAVLFESLEWYLPAIICFIVFLYMSFFSK